jgi:hypothetical protein
MNVLSLPRNVGTFCEIITFLHWMGDLPPVFGSPALYVKRMKKRGNMICLPLAPLSRNLSTLETVRLKTATV